MWLVGTLWLVHAIGVQTDNRSTLLEQVMPRGLGPPTHRHPLAVEGFYVLEGTVGFHVDGRTVRAETGTLIHLLRMTPHAFTVESEETRVLNFYAPAGSEIHLISLAHAAEERRRPTMEESAPPKSDELNQTLSRLYGSVGVTALPFSVPPSEELLVTRPGVWGARTIKVATAQDAPVFEAFGMQWRLHKTFSCPDAVEYRYEGLVRSTRAVTPRFFPVPLGLSSPARKPCARSLCCSAWWW